ncbi:MAG: helix-turn-helix domain-containing protein [Mucilaginibacter sp.]|nr:helix-turn-helix domain-containing protein [Mucilaginibacter sp.]
MEHNQFRNEVPSQIREQPITIQDLLDFKEQLITDIKKLLKERAGVPSHQWLKAMDLKKMLRLSDGKLQYLRDKGIIPFKKLGGVTYYNLDEIQELMNAGKLSTQ